MHARSFAQLCPTLNNLMNLALQAPLSMGFPRQEYWSGLLFPTSGDLPHPGIESVSLVAPALQAIVFFTTVPLVTHIFMFEWLQ